MKTPLIDALILCFEGAMMSFGEPVLDGYGPTSRFPIRSMIVGVIANALGIDRYDVDALETLQRRLQYAVRCDRPGRLYTDLQIADFRTPWMRGARIGRGGLPAGRRMGKDGHTVEKRHREFLMDALYYLAVTFGEGTPSLDDIEASLKKPARILFLGRRNCLPSSYIYQCRVQANTLTEALQAFPGEQQQVQARWPAEEGPPGRVIALTEDKDWANTIHVGERLMKEGVLEVVSP